MFGAVPMADGSHKAFGTAHVPRTGVGEDFGDPCDGFAAPGGGHDGSDLCRLAGANDLVDPEHVVPYEISGFLDCAIEREGERFLWVEEEIMRLTP